MRAAIRGRRRTALAIAGAVAIVAVVAVTATSLGLGYFGGAATPTARCSDAVLCCSAAVIQ